MPIQAVLIPIRLTMTFIIKVTILVLLHVRRSEGVRFGLLRTFMILGCNSRVSQSRKKCNGVYRLVGLLQAVTGNRGMI